MTGETAAEAMERIHGPFREHLARTLAEDIEIAADIDAIRAGTMPSIGEPESGGF